MVTFHVSADYLVNDIDIKYFGFCSPQYSRKLTVIQKSKAAVVSVIKYMLHLMYQHYSRVTTDHLCGNLIIWGGNLLRQNHVWHKYCTIISSCLRPQQCLLALTVIIFVVVHFPSYCIALGYIIIHDMGNCHICLG